MTARMWTCLSVSSHEAGSNPGSLLLFRQGQVLLAALGNMEARVQR